MKFPEDVRRELSRRFNKRHRDWLAASTASNSSTVDGWPLEIKLGIPTENRALEQVDGVRAWVAAWQTSSDTGSIVWTDRRWRALGTQRVPEKLLLEDPAAVARWAGEAERWDKASRRYAESTERWPRLARKLARYFDLLADYSDADFQRLVDMLIWIEAHPDSQLYPRQLPVAGLDSKWLEKRKGVLADIIDTLRDEHSVEGDFFERCGLKTPPQLVRLRLLDSKIREQVGGLCDISAPWEQLAGLDIPAKNVFIVENLQTGLAFEDLPESAVIMHLGYGVDLLGRFPWIARAHCFYWGDLDTHGFAILSRARAYLPDLKSALMDEETLHRHRELCVEEKTPHGALTLPLLTEAEQALYRAIKSNTWGQNIRLEQERVAWDFAWPALQQLT